MPNKYRWPFHYGYIIVLCCFVMMAVNVGLVMSCAGLFYKPMSEDLGVNVGVLGVYMSFNYLASMLFLPTAGTWIERYNARWLLGGSSVLLGVLLGLLSVLTQVWQLYVVGAMMGVAMAFQLYLATPVLINRWFKSRIGLMLGLCSAASGIGGVLFSPIVTHLITLYGWRTTYQLFAALVVLGVSPLLFALLRHAPHEVGSKPYERAQTLTTSNAPATGCTYAQAVRLPHFYALFVFALLMIASSTLNLFIPKYLTHAGYTLEQAGAIASAIMLGVTVSKVALGGLNDLSAYWGVVATCVCGMLGLLLLLLVHDNWWWATVGGFLYGWAYAGPFVQTPLLARRVFGHKEHTRIYATLSIALAAGGAALSGGWGLIAEATSYAFILATDVALLGLGLLIGVVVLRTKPTF